MSEKRDRRLTGDGPTTELGKIARFLNWFSPSGFIENMTNRAIRREREKKAKKEKTIRKLLEMTATHDKNIRELAMKIAESQIRVSEQKEAGSDHPGEVLRKEFLKPNRITKRELSQRLGIPFKHVNQIVRGEIEITADDAGKLGEYFNIEPEFWLNLQSRYNLKVNADE